MESTSVEALRKRLQVCRQQLVCNSVINTSKRKEALRIEIYQIEHQLAEALGINDDEDDSEEAPEQSDAHPDSPHSPLIHSSSTHTPRPLDSLSKEPKVKTECTWSETPPISGINTTTNCGIGSSTALSSSHKSEAESVRSALVEAGEQDVDLEVLLKEQAMMERRFADMKRRREEEDEAFARSVQEEEYRIFHPQTFSRATYPWQPAQTRTPYQERMDAEMARIFAESESSSSSFNLTNPPINNTGSSSTPSRPVFPIFEKRLKREDVTTGPSNVSMVVTQSFTTTTAGPSTPTPGFYPVVPTMPTMPIPPAFISGPGFFPAPNMFVAGATDGRLQNHAAAMLASAAKDDYKQMMPGTQLPGIYGIKPEPIPQSQITVDLTKPTIDLTKQIYEIHSSDEEDVRGSSSTSALIIKDEYSKTFANSFTTIREKPDPNESFDVYDYDDDDDDDEGDDYGYLYKHDQWMYNQSYSWDQTRNLTPQQSEQELRDLLANIQAAEEDIAPQDRTGTPDGMASHLTLLEHQKIGLTWLQKMENGTNRGGILGDDMGLGKTVQTIALIVSRPSPPIDDPVIWNKRKTHYEPPPPSFLVKTKATLVVAPLGLIHQWAEEIRSKTQPGLLNVLVYHGSNRPSNPEHLRQYDVIITTTATLTNEAGQKDTNPDKAKAIGTLFKVRYHRVVIDEAHGIKNRHTKSSKACALVAANYRWCLTGTPVQNNVEELYSLIRFLAIKPYCDWDEFRSKIATPMKKTRQYGPAMQRVQALMKAVCLRRTKKCQVDGKPILDLPDRNVVKLSTPFSDDERAFYHALEQRTRERFNAYVRAGTVMKNYSNILVLLLRLRQACCHPHLINDFEKVQDGETPTDQKAHVDRLLDGLLDDIRRRLIERGSDAVECPICMDVGEESVILSGCGHIYCRACIVAHLSRHDEDDRKCPECRGAAPLDNLISVADFNARYCPVTEAEPEDIKGKGKAQDDDENAGPDRLPKVLVPEVLEDWISSSKVDKMIELVRSVMAKKEKIIVFSQFTSLLTLIEKPLNAENIKYLRYDGSMKLEERNEAVRRLFDDPDYAVMLISLKCGSLGLNLTVANHVVIMDPWWNPALENQAIDRVHRIGQTKDVFVHRLCIPETVEDRILALQAQKQNLADGALGEGEVQKLAKLGLQELIYLFRG